MTSFSAGNIHEGEFVSIPARFGLPINKTASTVLRTMSLSPVPLHLLQNQSPPRDTLPPMADHAQTVHEECVDPDQPDHSILSMVHKWSHTHSILSVVAAPSKGLVICGTQDSRILVFEVSTFALVHKINCGHRLFAASVLCMTLDPTETFLFSAGLDSLVKVWDLSPFDDLSASAFDIKCTHLAYSSIDIGDIFSISWSAPLSTLFIGAQNASVLWCTFDLATPGGAPKASVMSPSLSTDSMQKLPHLRFDRFFDSKGPGGSVNRAQRTHDLLRKSGLAESATGPSLVEFKNDNIIKFAHNGYVYCMEFLSKKNASEFCDLHKGLYETLLVTCGGDGVIKIWGVTAVDGTFKLEVIASMENEEAILSMHVVDSFVFVGLGDSSINAWDLTTFQLTRSFNFICDCTKQNDEILSLCIHDGYIYKASNNGGLCKFNLQNNVNEEADVKPDSKKNQTNLNFAKLLSKSSIEVDDSSVFVVHTFEYLGNTYLVSGGAGSLCLWNITGTGAESKISSASSTQERMRGNLIESSNEHLMESLKRLITYKTISKYPVMYLEESRKCARYLGKLFMNLGAADTKLLPVENCNPIVYAKFKRNKAGSSESLKRVLWYGHYDVVDAARESSSWETDPFSLHAKDGNLYGRGVSDNKGPVLAAMYAVAELTKNEQLSTDVVFLIEGEEECGSIGFQDVVNDHRDLIGHIDWVMLSNSYWLGDEIPCLNFGLRGVINASITVESEKPDRHSGVDGGVSREPMMDMLQTLSELCCKQTNRIKIPGFYDKVMPVEESELRLYEKIKESAKGSDITEADLDSLVAKWRNPSLTVHRLDVSGPKNNTVISQKAKASISIRVVPNQELSEIKRQLVSFLHEKFAELKSENELSVNIFHEAEPWLGDPGNLVYQVLFEKLKKVWGPSVPEPLFIREGGSIPSIRFLEKAFNAPAAQIPCGQASDNAHLMNEKLRIINMFKLKEILQETFAELGLRDTN